MKTIHFFKYDYMQLLIILKTDIGIFKFMLFQEKNTFEFLRLSWGLVYNQLKINFYSELTICLQEKWNVFRKLNI